MEQCDFIFEDEPSVFERLRLIYEGKDEEYEICDLWQSGRLTVKQVDLIHSFINEKLKNGIMLNGFDIMVVFDSCNGDIEYIEDTAHGWWSINYIFTFDDLNYYRLQAYYHPEYGLSDDIEDQICPRVHKKKVVVEKWVTEDEE